MRFLYQTRNVLKHFPKMTHIAVQHAANWVIKFVIDLAVSNGCMTRPINTMDVRNMNTPQAAWGHFLWNINGLKTNAVAPAVMKSISTIASIGMFILAVFAFYL